jgi:predicted phosphate transport protein (TIGR00153 family)
MFALLHKDAVFYELFERGATVLQQIAQAYANLVANQSRQQEHLAEIRRFEHDGDEIARKTLLKVDTTFITPFDREDIHTLVIEVDDVIDAIDAAAKRIVLFKITETNTWLVKQTEVLVKATSLLADAIGKLRHLRKPDALRDYLIQIHRLESVGDDNHHTALVELFERTHDPIGVMKLKEVLDLTEEAIDGCQDIAITIERIILKGS